MVWENITSSCVLPLAYSTLPKVKRMMNGATVENVFYLERLSRPLPYCVLYHLLRIEYMRVDEKSPGLDTELNHEYRAFCDYRYQVSIL